MAITDQASPQRHCRPLQAVFAMPPTPAVPAHDFLRDRFVKADDAALTWSTFPLS